ncbi:hypothetical protein K7G98_15550 [Saccharothrix sp. MB29]|nr:hypothetical protein [Saccharothrix sp. MB29]
MRVRRERPGAARARRGDDLPGDVLRCGASRGDVPRPARGGGRGGARRGAHDARFHRDPLPALLTRALLEDAAPVVGTVELAELHGALAARAALAGLREEAVGASRREVVLYRRAAGDDPEHRLSLADALGDLGLRLVAVGRAGEALEVAREEVRLLRVVVAGDDDHLPRLAVALDRLGLRHASLGNGEEALAAVAEAAARYGESVKRDPALFGPEQAKVTHHHAVRLLDVGRREEAVRTARLAVARWREVAEGDPRFEAESARALRSVASLLSAADDLAHTVDFTRTDDLAGTDEALGVVQESISLLRRLARANPADFEPELASALGEASALLRRRHRFAEALAASGEAVLLRRRAARDADPDAVARLASALVEQVDVLREPERSAAAEEAADLLRPLAARLPAHRVAFAVALARVARVLLDADRDHEACRVVDEVTSIDPRLPRPLLVARGPGWRPRCTPWRARWPTTGTASGRGASPSGRPGCGASCWATTGPRRRRTRRPCTGPPGTRPGTRRCAGRGAPCWCGT